MWRLRQFVDKAQDLIAPEAPLAARPQYGFRVLHVEDSESQLEALFDYIVSVDGTELECQYHGPEPAAPMETFYNLLGSASRVGVWSSKGGTVRSVEVRPQPSEHSFGLGLSVRWTSTECADHVWHVLDVKPGSPAAAAGLLAHSDYIVGADNGMLEGGGEQLLGRAIGTAAHSGVPLLLFVYNYDYDTVRPVRISPRTDPFGNASMGASIGYGLLHRIPARAGSEDAPGSTLYEDTSDSSNAATFEPLNAAPSFAPEPEATPAAAPAAAPAPAPGRRKHAHAAHAATPALGDYFSEQQQISRERDGTRKAAAAAAAAPPPKSK